MIGCKAGLLGVSLLGLVYVGMSLLGTFHAHGLVYANAGELFRDEYVSIPKEDDLIEELGAMTYGRNSKGQVMIARKKDIKKILGRSTDYADALVMGLWGASKAKKEIQVPQTVGASEDDDYDFLRGGL